MLHRIRVAVFLCIALAISPGSHSAGFDCNPKLTRVEQAICDDQRLSELDMQLNAIYECLTEGTKRSHAWVEGLNAIQLFWLKKRNSARMPIGDDSLAVLYRNQLSRLKLIDQVVHPELYQGRARSAGYMDLANDAVQSIYRHVIA